MQHRLAVGELGRVTWHISTRSPNTSGNCVEAGAVEDGTERVALRHSHHPRGHAFVYDGSEWHAFLTTVKRGAYDFPTS